MVPVQSHVRPLSSTKTSRARLTRNPQKIRPTWNKYNLYNLSRLRSSKVRYGTFFQQKWAAKRATRAYHGEHIREGKWSRMFSRRIPAVVPMNVRAMALQDGREQSAGRGSGKDTHISQQHRGRAIFKPATAMTPYASMTFWPLERRLDMAIWRSLFASSLRQAAQFVTHGHVRVNGKLVSFDKLRSK
jgi:ribosomal protein S4